jgi:(p)ppGpp synthase/HD superfamily hydrolase
MIQPINPANPSHDAIEVALKLALHFHTGQRDKAGACYMLHLMRVMLACSTAEAMQVAVLHDLLEDTQAVVEDLIQAGLGRNVIDAVTLLTKPDSMQYSQYILRLSENPIATEVKLADLQDNYRLDRVAYRDDCDLEDSQRIQRYILAFQFLRGDRTRESFLKRMEGVDSK